jgi:hypothetical protein
LRARFSMQLHVSRIIAQGKCATNIARQHQRPGKTTAGGLATAAIAGAALILPRPGATAVPRSPAETALALSIRAAALLAPCGALGRSDAARRAL